MSVGQFSGSPPPPAPSVMTVCRPARSRKDDHRPSTTIDGSPRHHSFSGAPRPEVYPQGSKASPIAVATTSSSRSRPDSQRRIMKLPPHSTDSTPSMLVTAASKMSTSTNGIQVHDLSSIDCFNGQNYIWLNEAGRPTSPPSLNYDNLSSSRNNGIKRIVFDLGLNDNLGLMIRGGIEYGLGIFITGVEPNSAALRNDLRVGDEILECNGRTFHRMTHDDAVRILKCSQTFDLVVRHIGKVPHSTSLSGTDNCEMVALSSSAAVATLNPPSTARCVVTTSHPHRISCFCASSPSSTTPSSSSCNHQVSTDSRMVLLEPRPNHATHNQAMFLDLELRGRSNSTPMKNERLSTHRGHSLTSFDPGRQYRMDIDKFRQEINNEKAIATSGESPELSMILDKAQVLLNRDEFTTLSILLADYQSGEINVDRFAAGILCLIDEAEKTSFFTEIREIVRSDDLSQFDCLIYQKGNLLDKLLRTSGRLKVVGSFDEEDQEEDLEWILQNDQDEDVEYLGEDSQNDEDLSGSEERFERSFLRENLRHTTNGALPDSGNTMNLVGGSARCYPAMRNSDRENGGLELVDNVCQRESSGKLRRSVPQISHQDLVALQRQRDLLLDDDGKQAKVCEGGVSSRYKTSHEELKAMPFRLPEAPLIRIRGGRQTVYIPKCCTTLGIAIEGGSNTKQPIPRIISIQPSGAAYQTGGLRIGQLIREVDGISLEGLPHNGIARLIAECYAKRSRPVLTLVVQDQIRTPAEMRRSFMLPQ